VGATKSSAWQHSSFSSSSMAIIPSELNRNCHLHDNPLSLAHLFPTHNRYPCFSSDSEPLLGGAG
jgi:hypothetical protein